MQHPSTTRRRPAGRRSRNATITTMSVCFIFIVCYLPYVVSNVIGLYNPLTENVSLTHVSGNRQWNFSFSFVRAIDTRPQHYRKDEWAVWNWSLNSDQQIMRPLFFIINSLRNKIINRMEISWVILAKREHSRLAISHMMNWYVVDVECENHCKQLHDLQMA